MDKLVKTPKAESGSSKPRIAQCFLNADLRGSHNSLRLMANDNGLDLDEIGSNQFVVFVNKKRTLMKVWAGFGTFSFTRRERIDLNAIKYLPRVFGATGDLNYDSALEQSLRDRLGVKERPTTNSTKKPKVILRKKPQAQYEARA